MIEINMPQDILKYKTKAIGNFSVREAIWGGIGCAAGIYGFFSLFAEMSKNPRIYSTAALALPFFLFGFVKWEGLPLEKAISAIVYDNIICPAKRRYEIHHPEYETYRKAEGLDAEKMKPQNKKNIKVAKPSKQFKGIK